MPSVRRLTAILAADVAGYSRLMGADEEGTHERLKGHFRELVNPKIEAGQPQYRCAAGRWSWAGGLDCKNRSKPAPDFGRKRQVISAESGT